MARVHPVLKRLAVTVSLLILLGVVVFQGRKSGRVTQPVVSPEAQPVVGVVIPRGVEREPASPDILESTARPEILEVVSAEEAGRLQSTDIRQYESGRTRPAVVRPEWRVGQSWEVETFYRQLQSETQHWPSWFRRWRFEVRARDVVDQEPSYELLAESDGYRAKLWVRERDFQLTAIEEGTSARRTVSGGNSLAPFSIVPFEMVPGGTPGSELESVVGRPVPDPQWREPAREIPRAYGKVVDVEISLPGGSRLVQRWDSARPAWPLCTRTRGRLSYLRRCSP